MHVLSFPSAQEVQRTGKSVVRMAEYFAMLVYQTIDSAGKMGPSMQVRR
jgi:hypothetical protein